jgi:coenzyme PQQ precursor peptide PqqA
MTFFHRWLQEPRLAPFLNGDTTIETTRIDKEIHLYLEFSFGGALVEWTTPSFEEVDLSCEISSYANAEL